MVATDPDARTRVGVGLVTRRPHREAIHLGNTCTQPARRWSMVTLCTIVAGLAAAAHADPVVVPGTSNIFGAGHTLAPDPGSYGPGTLPPMIDLFLAPSRTITFDTVTGSVSCLPVLGWNGADGGPYATGNTDILSYGGISGIIHDHATMFLVGVFTNGQTPPAAAPARLNVTTTTSNAVFTPLLFQSFFIGDGKTGTGSGAVQIFHVPDGATQLYLGFEDAYGFGNPTDYPGSYNDNAGFLTVNFTLVPSPGALGLGACSSCLLLRRRRRSRG